MRTHARRLQPSSDPLNIPEDLIEEPDGFRISGATAAPSQAGSVATRRMSGASGLRGSGAAPRTSDEILRSLPEKLRGQATHAAALADNALLAFIVINAALQRSTALAEYCSRSDVQARLGPGCRVGMGFGLHAG